MARFLRLRTNAPARSSARPDRLRAGEVERAGARLLTWGFRGCVALTLVVVCGTLAVLLAGSLPFFAAAPWGELFSQSLWTPFHEDPRLSFRLPLFATLQICAGAAALAAPLAVPTAVFLEYYASGPIRSALDRLTGALASVPTIVLAFLAVGFVAPSLRKIWPGMDIFSGLAACATLAVMILPTIISVSRRSLRTVPDAVARDAVALGSTKGRVILKIALPTAWRGILGSVLLGMARVAGETMIVTLAAGQQARWSLSPLEGLQPLAGYILRVTTANAPTVARPDIHALFAAAALLAGLAAALGLAGRGLLRAQLRAPSG